MPTYEYERADGTRFEIRQSFHDDALTVDPETGQPVRRLLSAPPVIFKGSGWYITDSRPSSSSSDSAVSSSTSSGATEATPTAEATKAEATTPAATGSDSGTTSTSSGGSETKDRAASSNSNAAA